jgi:hypothetical protein
MVVEQKRIKPGGTGEMAMNHPQELDHTPQRWSDYSDDDAFDGFVEDDSLDAAALYQEIAERRAQLECAETLRRARAL